MSEIQHLSGHTTHIRRGEIENRFRYGIDYVLLDMEADQDTPFLFSKEGFNLASVRKRDHGGERGNGTGAAWVREVLRAHGYTDGETSRIRLLTQPRFLSYWFNPVSFWLVTDSDDLRAVIAEVNNPFGDRHSYLCHLEDFAPIMPGDKMRAKKVFHVSPFQRIAGDYEFTFNITGEQVAISIRFLDNENGLIATLSGPLAPLTSGSILRAAIRRPTGALRTIILIYWQALKLRLKGASYRTRPEPPKEEVTQ